MIVDGNLRRTKQRKIASFAAPLIVLLGTTSAEAQSTKDDATAVGLANMPKIIKFAKDLCGSPTAYGFTHSTDGKLAGKASVTGILKYFSDVGISGSLKGDISTWNGPLQKDFAAVQISSTACAQDVFSLVWKTFYLTDMKAERPITPPKNPIAIFRAATQVSTEQKNSDQHVTAPNDQAPISQQQLSAPNAQGPISMQQNNFSLGPPLSEQQNELELRTLESDLTQYADMPEEVTGDVAAVSLLEGISSSNRSLHLFSLLGRYRHDTILSIPTNGNALYEFKKNYSAFRVNAVAFERYALVEIGKHVKVRFSAGGAFISSTPS